jgi:hypothetical protein
VASKKDPNLPASAKAEPDETMKGFLKLQDMPSFRDPNLPVWRPGESLAYPRQVRRSSVAPAMIDPLAVKAAALAVPTSTDSEDDDAGE